jgi:hypothetical protein
MCKASLEAKGFLLFLDRRLRMPLRIAMIQKALGVADRCFDIRSDAHNRTVKVENLEGW